MTSISVALATYNGAKYIRTQLDSLAAQSKLPDELVVNDDASTDETAEIIEDFSKSAPFKVRFERNSQNVGYNANFDKALSRCEGDIVFICDQDDYWLPEKIERVSATFEQRPNAMMVVNDQVLGDADLQDTGQTLLGRNASIGRSDDHSGWGSTMAVRREFFGLALPIGIGKDALDYDAWLNYMAVTLGVRVTIHDVLQIHRRHGSNVSNTSQHGVVRKTARNSVKRKVRADSRREWPVLINRNSMFLERFKQRHGWLAAHGLAERSNKEVDRLTERTQVLKRRSAAVDSALPKRAMRLLVMLASGDYRQFSGWKSALRDLVR